MKECCGGKTCSYFNDTYKKRIYLFVGSGEQIKRYLAEKHGCKDYEITPDFGGELLELREIKSRRTGPLIVTLKKMDFTCSDYASLAHECLHVATKILYSHGVPVGKDGKDEALAYLFDAIYESFLKELHRDLKKAEAVPGKH